MNIDIHFNYLNLLSNIALFLKILRSPPADEFRRDYRHQRTGGGDNRFVECVAVNA